MADIDERPQGVMINRAPVLTLWAAAVAECPGLDREEALSGAGPVSAHSHGAQARSPTRQKRVGHRIFER